MRLPLILDMVHHNPGEPPFQTAFLDPGHLARAGYNGQVFKHLNCIATFAATGVNVFPVGTPDRAWLNQMTAHIVRQIADAKARGLRVYYHLDLFVLPRRLVEHFRSEITDPATGRISLDAPCTLALHRVLFDELVTRFPEVDGFIIRVGETYLFDTPYHVGNGPIPVRGPGWTPTYQYPEVLAGAPAPVFWGEPQAEAYVRLLRFLREEICVKHARQVIFRTWDTFPDRLHARADHFRAVTEAVAPHPNLVFSIKHTALDFWRRVKVNECLGMGSHRQVVEVQCQREYEGKGAHPNYVMAGVIEGFEENARPIGLRQLIARHPAILGVYGWSRGGGWYGPYLRDEFWCDLNAQILARWAVDPTRSEPEVFAAYARGPLGLSDADAVRFRELCLLSATAVLKGRGCEAFDRELKEVLLPTACWMRDDRLGGAEQLRLVLQRLAQTNGFADALAEKAEAVRLWERIVALAEVIHWPDASRHERVRVSAEYGLRLYTVVRDAWRVMIAAERVNASARDALSELGAALDAYAASWSAYQALGDNPHAASLYRDVYFGLPGQEPAPGIGQTVAACRALFDRLTGSRPPVVARG